MHRVLQTLHERLDMLDTSLKCTNAVLLGAFAASPCRLIGRLDASMEPSDPLNETLVAAHG